MTTELYPCNPPGPDWDKVARRRAIRFLRVGNRNRFREYRIYWNRVWIGNVRPGMVGRRDWVAWSRLCGTRVTIRGKGRRSVAVSLAMCLRALGFKRTRTKLTLVDIGGDPKSFSHEAEDR